jgi:transglutaminase-like putative cysteine protease
MLQKYSAKFWLVCALLCLQTSITFAQGKNFFITRNEPSWTVKINPKTYSIGNKDVTDGYYIALYEDQNQVELKEVYRHIIRKILTQSGVQNGSEISVSYDPNFQKLTFHKVTVWRNNRKIDRLASSKFKVLQNEKELSKFIYHGTYDAFLILDDIRKGDRIEYSYSIKGQNPIFGNKYANTFYFEGSSSYGHRYTNLIVSDKRPLRFKSFNFSDKPKSRELAGLRVYEWESTATASRRVPDHEPSWYVPEKYTQVSEYQSWNDVVNWGLEVNSYPNLETPLLNRDVRQLQILSRDQPEKYIELATRFVQDEIRYMGIEMGEYSQRPNSPEKVLLQRYGDCKDKSMLLMYLLNKVNIPAYMAYVDTYSGKYSSDFLPSPFLFDHVVVVVEYNHGKTWIDPTIANQRGDFKSIYFPNYGQALVLKPGVNKPEDVISIPTGKLVSELNFIVPDTLSGKQASLVITSTYTDNYADNMRSTIADDGQNALEKDFKEYINQYYPEAENNGEIVIKDDENSNTITIIESYLISNIWLRSEKSSTKPYIYFYGDLVDADLRRIKEKNRKEPFALKYPINVEESITVVLPAAWDYKDQMEQVESDSYYYEFSSHAKGNVLKLNYSYRNFKDHIESRDMRKYARDSKKIAANLSTYINYGGGTVGANDARSVNPYLILLGMISFAGSAVYFFLKYQERSVFQIQDLIEAPGIGGWLAFLAFFIVFDPLYTVICSGSLHVFSMRAEYGTTVPSEILLIMLKVAQVLFLSIAFSWSILILSLYFKKREILPTQYINYMYYQIAGCLIIGPLNMLVNHFSGLPLFTFKGAFVTMLSLAICVAWIFYFKKSRRVKRTFVFTYPELPWRTAMIKHANARITGTFENKKEQS